MSEARVRFIELERGAIDLKTGEFPMVLATDGEASDGDILSIEGAVFSGRAPLQLSHVNDPRDTLGTVSGFRRDLQATPKRLRAKGMIEMGGDGPSADIRRDVAYMISQGHVTGISVRWDPIKFVPRSRLEKGHPAFVAEDEKDSRKRYGTFYEKWRVLEGSVVAVQADQQAMVGRSEETEGHVSAFWRAMALDAKPVEEIEGRSAPQPPVEPVPEPEPAPEVEPEPEVIEEPDQEPAEKIDAPEEALEARPEGRVNGSPSEPDIARFMRELLAESKAQHETLLFDFRAYVNLIRGRVCRDDAEAAGAARFRQQLEEVRGKRT